LRFKRKSHNERDPRLEISKRKACQDRI